jgi:hypothetical protein
VHEIKDSCGADDCEGNESETEIAGEGFGLQTGD